ncbi:MAG: DUF998 domain-containing protein [Ilumatobacteraceae bacterium]
MAQSDSLPSAGVPDRFGVSGAGGWRLGAIGGVVGPAAFIGAWVVGSATTAGYSPVDDAISRLAAIGASTEPLMTAGFVVFGIGVPIYATALRRALGGLACWTAAVTGLATIGVAALPLDRSSAVDTWHGAAAGIAYLTLAATPLLARRPLRQRGRRRSAALSGLVAAATATSLALSLTGLPTGLFQRIGLTTGHLWIMGSATAILLARPGQSRTEGPGPAAAATGS